ncbi:MAG: prephenate dehydratase [Longimicrobiales bacterium]
MGAGSPRVAFQGEPGAFSEEAIEGLFGLGVAVACPHRDFADVAGAVLTGAAEFGVLPAENSIHGSVTPTHDVLAGGGLSVLDEIICPIHLCLMALPGVQQEQLRTVLSHPVALNQCRRFFAQSPGLEAVPFYDTAGAARDVAARADVTAAAVASRAAAARYGLDILAASIEDRPDNQTRFFLVARSGEAQRIGELDGGSCKAVLMVDAAHQPGSLLGVLAPFAARGINLTRIESRPGPVAWTYHFFVEAVAAGGRAELEDALQEVERAANRVTVFGIFQPQRRHWTATLSA